MNHWVESGDGVFVRHHLSLSLNIGVVDCGEALLLVDTRGNHRQARRLKAAIARLSPLPVRWVVNTHHHWDHTFGNAEFLPAPIWGHERCASRLVDEGRLTLDRLRLAYGESAGPELDEVAITPPDHTFTDSVTIECGSRRVDLLHPGPGHTDNDIALVVDGGRVVFAGDLIEESGPPAYDDAYPLEWPGAAARLLELAAGPVVPGHGRVVDRAFVATQAGEIAEVARLAAERHSEGMPIEDAARAGGPFPIDTLMVAFRRAWEHLDRGDRPW